MRLLIDGQDDLPAVTREVLRAGLETAEWVSVDDTCARHRGASAVCTQIGNAAFTRFGTTGSKSRLNFLDLLRAGHTDYVINDEALDYMRGHALTGPAIRQPVSHRAIESGGSPTRPPGSTISSSSASPVCRCRPIRCASPPRARYGARSADVRAADEY